MTLRIFKLNLILMMIPCFCQAQGFVRTSDLFNRPAGELFSGNLNIIQDQSVDTLLSRYILANKKQRTTEGKQGMPGYRIQIYYSNVRNAREVSNKTRADFMIKFPDIPSYASYSEPGYFKIRAGDFRTKTEGTRYLLSVRREFPDAILVQDIINFPDLVKK
ncbi:MAG: SPOR domain-containing protein [Bacteroidales bacterium]|nr:SPOR domain-containing protein [Bacteroidales bacterium]